MEIFFFLVKINNKNIKKLHCVWSHSQPTGSHFCFKISLNKVSPMSHFDTGDLRHCRWPYWKSEWGHVISSQKPYVLRRQCRTLRSREKNRKYTSQTVLRAFYIYVTRCYSCCHWKKPAESHRDKHKHTCFWMWLNWLLSVATTSNKK